MSSTERKWISANLSRISVLHSKLPLWERIYEKVDSTDVEWPALVISQIITKECHLHCNLVDTETVRYSNELELWKIKAFMKIFSAVRWKKKNPVMHGCAFTLLDFAMILRQLKLKRGSEPNLSEHRGYYPGGLNLSQCSRNVTCIFLRPCWVGGGNRPMFWFDLKGIFDTIKSTSAFQLPAKK